MIAVTNELDRCGQGGIDIHLPDADMACERLSIKSGILGAGVYTMSANCPYRLWFFA